ncbi:MAG: selenocysteine-specific translation elongation factor [Candidatus Geothermincolia bacterium]
MTPSEHPRNLIIGTAGHIDHGKTVLVKALTGRDTDRLAEEKERGISIDLGFAPLQLSDGSTVGIVDVPGHENFVRNMMSGATGVDLALLVVAADDGVMPQTREHLAILDLLGVQRGVVAITKIDTVDPELVPLVEDEVNELLEGTPLEGSPVVPVSGITSEGIDRLRTVIEAQAGQVRLKDEALPTRMPIDRVFTLRGIGTVVTGTLWSGTVSTGQKLEALPRGDEARVRSLQVHDVDRETAFAGERVAINIAGAAKDRIARGDVLAAPSHLRPTYMADARVRILRSWTKPVRRGARIRFHHGTREVLGRIYPLDGQQLGPGDSRAAQIRLEERVVVAPGDRFVIRSYSPVTTIGGGVVVDAHPAKHKLRDPEAIRQFDELESSDDVRRVEVYLDRSPQPVTEKSLVLRSGLPPAVVGAGIAGLMKAGRAVAFGDKASPVYLSAARYGEARQAVTSTLTAYHSAKPLSEGMAKETLKNKALSAWDARSADIFMDSLAREGAIESSGTIARIPGATAAVTTEQEDLLNDILGRVSANPVSPPTVSELAAELDQTRQSVAELLAVAEKDRRVVRVSPDLFFSPDALAGIEATLREKTGPQGISVSDFKTAIGTSRKFALPLLEYFDRNRVTARVGDVRMLR